MKFIPKASPVEAYQFCRDGDRLWEILEYLADNFDHEDTFLQMNGGAFSSKSLIVEIGKKHGLSGYWSGTLREGDYLMKDPIDGFKIIPQTEFEENYQPNTKETNND